MQDDVGNRPYSLAFDRNYGQQRHWQSRPESAAAASAASASNDDGNVILCHLIFNDRLVTNGVMKANHL